jgi:hypothetical protein
VEPAARPLVRDGRVDVAVADHRDATLEGRPDRLVDVLGARGGVEQRLRPRCHVTAVQEELADLLPQLGPARLTRGDDLQAVSLEPPAEEVRLGRLARAVEAFEGDEHGAILGAERTVRVASV